MKVVGCASIVIAFASSLASAQNAPPDSQSHIAKAMEAHEKNDFATALVELEAAYAIDPVPDLLYAIGQVHVKLDRCADAITFYKRYLQTSPVAQARVDTEHAIKTCEAKLAPPESTTDAGKAPTAPTATPWYKDKLGGALVITGVAAGIAGAIAYSSAIGDLDAAEASNDITDYRGHVDDASSKRMISVILFAAGAGLVIGGVVRYTTRSDAAHESALTIAPTEDGGLVSWGGRF